MEKEELLKELKQNLTGFASIDRPWLSVYRVDDILRPLPKMTAYQYLWENNKDYLDNVALSYFGVEITYKELFQRIDKVNTAFQKMGVKPGDVVEIVCTNTPEIAYIFYALSKLGAIADIIDPRINENVMRKYLKDSKSNVFMCLDVSLPKYQDLLEESDIEYIVNLPVLESLPIPMQVVAKAKTFVESIFKHQPLPPKIKKDGKKVWSYKEFEALGKNPEPFEAEYKENTPVAILHTGGTTGVSKGAVLSNDNINASVEQYKKMDLKMQRGQSWIGLMPPCVSYGLANSLHLSLSNGMKMILIPTYEPEKIDKQILKYKPQRIACTTAHWETFEKSKLLEGKDLSFIINPIEGGDSLNINLERRINEKLHRNGCYDSLNKGFGLTECSGGLSMASPRVDQELLIGSTGYPFPNTIMGIFKTDEETGKITELKYNEIGEICACAPQIMLHYHNRPDETEHTLKVHDDGRTWIHTGDLGYFTEDGRLFHKGRIKRIVIRYDGTKVYPFDIESVIGMHPAIDQVAIIGIRDVKYLQGRLPKAYLVLKDEYKDQTEKVVNEVNELCINNLIDYMIPVDYEVIDSLPLTPMGKVDFKNLEDRNKEEDLLLKLTKKNK